MILTHISITNMAGFGTCEFSLPTVAIVQGKNRAGKTALARCIKYCFDQGHDEDLLTVGEEDGEIIVRLDNGGAVRATISKRTNSTSRFYQKPGERKWTPGRKFVDDVALSLSYDPLKFLEMNERDQVLTLLKLLGPSLTVTDEELLEALGQPFELDVSSIPDGLGKVDALLNEKPGSGSVYDRRREMNVAADTLKKHALEIEKALPPPSANPLNDSNWGTVAETKTHAIEQINREERQYHTEVAKVLQDVKDSIQEARIKKINEINADIDAQIKTLEADRARRLEANASDTTEAIDVARAEANECVAIRRKQDDPKRAALTQERILATERHQEWIRTEGSRSEIVRSRQSAAEKEARAVELSGVLDRLRALRIQIAERVPIKNAVIRDGRILDPKGVPLPKWNTEAQFAFALRLAVLTHKEAAFVVVDDCEHFDATRRKALMAACQKYSDAEKMQFILLSVGESELSVGAPEV
jgi:hypothetical protein